MMATTRKTKSWAASRPKPWFAVRYTPIPGCRPLDLKKARFVDASAMNQWVKKARLSGAARGQVIICWHQSQLTPPEVVALEAMPGPKLRLVQA